MTPLADFPRPHSLQKLLVLRDDPAVKLLTGPRRSGKTQLLRQCQAKLLETGVAPEQVISFNLEDPRLSALTEPEALRRAVRAKLKRGRLSYVFLDEIQACCSFEEVVQDLAQLENVRLCLTSSNARILSSDFTAGLPRRVEPLELLPLSFAEFRRAVAADGLSPADDFRRYLEVGGFPELVLWRDDPLIVNTGASSLIATLIEKDILPFHALRNVRQVEHVIHAVAAAIGAPVSAREIARALQKHQDTIANATAITCLHALEDAFFSFRVPRFDLEKKQPLATGEKHYLCDVGLRQILVASTPQDLKRLLENIVYLELRRRFSDVFIGTTSGQAVDFVARTGDDLRCYQVAVSLPKAGAFRPTDTTCPTRLLTLDTVPQGQYPSSLQPINLIDWLLADGEAEAPAEAA